ncbi:MAG: DNA-3-methyladenine glycosylase I, partial [Dehalococcoidia bacterium]|nr:DNA-3-methyladenine glycosylase I [Dehalococcoidia bacterium]
MAGVSRCAWPGDDPLMLAYHDTVWGVPEHDDRALFEFLTLEGAQAGLSWRTILHRQENYREAFHHWDIERIAAYGDNEVARLLADRGIIRNRAKVAATIGNAKATLVVQQEHGSLDAYLWGLVGGAPVQNSFREPGEIPAETPVARAMSKDLKGRGFRFVGPTICYAFMQATGMVNDHVIACFRWAEIAATVRTG